MITQAASFMKRDYLRWGIISILLTGSLPAVGADGIDRYAQMSVSVWAKLSLSVPALVFLFRYMWFLNLSDSSDTMDERYAQFLLKSKV